MRYCPAHGSGPPLAIGWACTGEGCEKVAPLCPVAVMTDGVPCARTGEHATWEQFGSHFGPVTVSDFSLGISLFAWPAFFLRTCPCGCFTASPPFYRGSPLPAGPVASFSCFRPGVGLAISFLLFYASTTTYYRNRLALAPSWQRTRSARPLPGARRPGFSRRPGGAAAPAGGDFPNTHQHTP